jgi:peptidyl-prolyl cis-trans isomerase C
MKKYLILIVAVALIFGCAQKREDSGKEFLAKVNAKTITADDFMKKLNTLPEWAKGRFQSEEGKREFLEEIIKEELLYQEAKKGGLDKDEDFKNKVEEFKRMNLVSTLLKKEVEEKVTVDDQEVRDFYNRHQESFKLGEEVKAQHILVATEEEAKDILKRILKKESFSELAKNFSKDEGTAKNSGELGFFGRGRMVPEFENAAFSLKPGEISEPVKTQFGYHIIKVLEKKEGKMRGFEEVKSTIQRRLKLERQKTIFESYINDLKAKSKKIDVNEEALKKLAQETHWESEGQ